MTFDDRRRDLLEAATAYVIREGLADLSLRPLARALGTSDRMLLYYFTSKDDLIAAVMATLSAQLRESLAAALPSGRATAADLLAASWAMMRDDAAAPALRAWFDIVGRATRGVEPYRSAARDVVGSWTTWLAERLDDTDDVHVVATAIIGAVDGLAMLQLVDDRTDVDAAAEVLVAGLRRRDRPPGDG